jgi:hypothetical protein
MKKSSDIELVDPSTYYPRKDFGFYLIVVLISIGLLMGFLRPFFALIRYLKSGQQESPVRDRRIKPKKMKKSEIGTPQLEMKLTWYHFLGMVFKSFDARNTWLHLLYSDRKVT